ncbi:hypothetical protein [Streptomyces sp. NPDC059009]|uniref:hypothetical protein n=1 Tax=Streptomyces sp. NPDC059009 TaxID=3346694 RepID=UPI00367650D5
MTQNLTQDVPQHLAPSADLPTPHRPRAGRALLWGLVPLLSVGLLSWLPLGWLAVRTRRWTHGLSAAAYAIGALASLILIPEDESDNAWVWLLVAVWFCGLVHTVVAFLMLRDGTTVKDTNRQALQGAVAREARRREARAMLAGNPAVARDLRIGRPDLPRTYDDGGLVDVNAVSAAVLVEHVGWTAHDAEELVRVRQRLGRFAGPAEVIAYTELSPDQVDAARDLLVFSA